MRQALLSFSKKFSKQRLKKFSEKCIEVLALSAIVFFSSAAHAVQPQNLGIAKTPLFLGFSVQPNIFFVSDDSGSMDLEILTPAYWRWYHYDPDPIRDGNYTSRPPTETVNGRNPRPVITRFTGGTFQSAMFGLNDTDRGLYGSIYSNDDNVFRNSCSNQGSPWRGRTESCKNSQNHPLDVDWRARSSDLNRVFYNANILYEPWDGPCTPSGTPCANASFISARSNPYSTQNGFGILRNLSTDGDANNGPFIYEVWIDDSGYTGDNIRPRPSPSPRPERGTRFNETGYAASAFGSATDIPDAPNGEVDLWDSHMRLTVSSTSISVSLVAYNPQNTAAGGLNETNLGGVITLNSDSCYKVLGNESSVQAIRDQIIKNPSNAAIDIVATGIPGDPGAAAGPECRTIAETRQNIANWYQYYRRRAYSVKNAIAEVMDAQASFRFGLTVLNNIDPDVTYVDDEGRPIGGKGIFVPLPAIDEDLSQHNERIKQEYFSFVQPPRGTPLRSALTRAGEYYKKGISLSKEDYPSPIIYPCQKNFTILLTDGFWNSDSGFSVGDPDRDTKPNTVADVAYKYYISDLDSTIDNEVALDLPDEIDLLGKTGTTSPEGPTFQHMVTFTVAFGVEGNLVDRDGDGNPDADATGNAWTVPAKNGKWGNPTIGGTADNIDDLWHAAFNSGGVFASASTPREVSDRLIKAIAAFSSRLGSAAAVALNSGTLNANSRLYQARFDSTGWSGNLFSVPIQDGFVDLVPPEGDDSPPECDGFAIGELCNPEWNAALELANRDYTTRKIFTMNTDDFSLAAFAWDTLGSAQQDALRVNPDAPPVAVPVLEPIDRGEDRLAYIQGDHTNEVNVNGDFRTRSKVGNYKGPTSLNVKNRLGDIVHSSPAFAGAPNFFYPESIEEGSYAEFKRNNRDRTGVVYVGTNDGMLHGFNAITGNEEFAYIPGFLVNKLNRLTSPAYNSRHEYYVDGSPIVFDAYQGGWKSILASSVGAGGQGVFGLDVTDPENFAGERYQKIW